MLFGMPVWVAVYWILAVVMVVCCSIYIIKSF